jgi:AraC family transcriptional regulator
VDISLANTELADIVRLEHGPEPLNLEPRNSVCAARGVNFVEASSFVLGYGKREWLIDQGCAFLTEAGRVHRYSHLRGAPPDTVLCVRFTNQLLECMRDELPFVQFERLEPVLGKRNDLRFMHWRLKRLLHECSDLSLDEWTLELVLATCFNRAQKPWRYFQDRQFSWYAERIEAARQHLAHTFPEQQRLRGLARSVGMSTFHFARVFRALVGAPPHQYLLSIRYRAALHMLLQGASVTEACFQTGFSNPSHFTRQFKARFGHSPSLVRTWSRDLFRRRFSAHQPVGIAQRK